MSVRSNLDQVRSDSRGPALWLLMLLLLSAAFFALGIIIGRWTTGPCPPQSPAPPPTTVGSKL